MALLAIVLGLNIDMEHQNGIQMPVDCLNRVRISTVDRGDRETQEPHVSFGDFDISLNCLFLIHIFIRTCELNSRIDIVLNCIHASITA